MVAETALAPADLVWPLFVHEHEASEPVASMPGVERLSIDGIVKAAADAAALGIPAVALFPVIDARHKTDDGRHALAADNLLCRTVRAIRRETGDAVGVICDVALDPYTTHGHDGLVRGGRIVNDETVEVLRRQAVVLAEAGCHVVAPSDMMDGRVGAIRAALDAAGREDVCILSYAAKYASAFYGPFRDAVAPVFDKLYESVRTGAETRIVLSANSAPDYREKLTAELQTMRNMEMWQAGAAVRALRPENRKR